MEITCLSHIMFFLASNAVQFCSKANHPWEPSNLNIFMLIRRSWNFKHDEEDWKIFLWDKIKIQPDKMARYTNRELPAVYTTYIYFRLRGPKSYTTEIAVKAHILNVVNEICLIMHLDWLSCQINVTSLVVVRHYYHFKVANGQLVV